MTRTLSPEMDEWLSDQAMLGEATRGRRMPGAAIVINCPLTDAEIDWLWPRFQACSFPPATFAKRFARTERAKLTVKGKNCCARLAYKYRRQIFDGSAKWTENDFLIAVREAAARKA